jgi:hypothetical protein
MKSLLPQSKKTFNATENQIDEIQEVIIELELYDLLKELEKQIGYKRCATCRCINCVC